MYKRQDLNIYIDYLQGAFHIGWTTLIPAILIIALLMFRVGAFEALGIGAIAGALVAIFVQGVAVRSILKICYDGFTSDTDIAAVSYTHLPTDMRSKQSGQPDKMAV